MRIVLRQVDRTVLEKLLRDPKVVHEGVPVRRRCECARDHDERDQQEDGQAEPIGTGAEAREHVLHEQRELPHLVPADEHRTHQHCQQHDRANAQPPHHEDRGRQRPQACRRPKEQCFQRPLQPEPASLEEAASDAGRDREHCEYKGDREQLVQDQQHAGVSAALIRQRQVSDEQAADRDQPRDRRVEGLHGDSGLPARARSESATLESPRARAPAAWFR